MKQVQDVSFAPDNGFVGFEDLVRADNSDNRQPDGSASVAHNEPRPVPRPLAGALAEVPALDPQLLPESIRPWVIDLAERFQVPADYPAAAVITMLAGALGRRALIRPKRHDDWIVYGSLWGGIVGRSGVMKSPIIHAALGPLRRRQALAIAIHGSELDEYQCRLAQCRGRKRTQRNAAALKWAGGLELGADTPQPRSARATSRMRHPSRNCTSMMPKHPTERKSMAQTRHRRPYESEDRPGLGALQKCLLGPAARETS